MEHSNFQLKSAIPPKMYREWLGYNQHKSLDVLSRIGMHYHFEQPIDILEAPINYKQTIQAQVIDMTDRLILDAIIQAARENGVDDLYVIDKTFILEAIAEKIERMKGENNV